MCSPCIFATAQVKAKPLSLSLVPGLCTLAWCHQSSSSTFRKGIWTSLHCTLSYTCSIVAKYLEWGIISQQIKVLPRWATWDEMREPKHHLIELLVLLKHCVPAICPKNVLSMKWLLKLGVFQILSYPVNKFMNGKKKRPFSFCICQSRTLVFLCPVRYNFQDIRLRGAVRQVSAVAWHKQFDLGVPYFRNQAHNVAHTYDTYSIIYI